jgi:hypothetical protein
MMAAASVFEDFQRYFTQFSPQFQGKKFVEIVQIGL